MQTTLSIQVNCDLPRSNSGKYSSGLANCTDVLFFFDGGAWHLLLLFFEYAHSYSSPYCFSLPNTGSYPNNTGIPCCDLTLIGATSCLHIPPFSFILHEVESRTWRRELGVIFFFVFVLRISHWMHDLASWNLNGNGAAERSPGQAEI